MVAVRFPDAVGQHRKMNGPEFRIFRTGADRRYQFSLPLREVIDGLVTDQGYAALVDEDLLDRAGQRVQAAREKHYPFYRRGIGHAGREVEVVVEQGWRG